MPLNHVSPFADLTPSQYAAVGKAVVEWANIEHLLGTILSRLLATPDFLARTYTKTMSAVRIQDALKDAIEIHNKRYHNRLVPKETLNEISKVLPKITALRSRRNKFAHFCWVRQDDETLFGTSFPSGVPSIKKQRREHAVLSTSELTGHNAEAHALVEQLMQLVEKLPEVTEESLLTNG